MNGVYPVYYVEYYNVAVRSRVPRVKHPNPSDNA